MEVPGMDEVKVAENRFASAAAFVEQDAFDDACSICLEAFSQSDPSTATICRHDFHLQCILEWCQRSSNCPMCWQPITLKDQDSQELLLAVEQERRFRSSSSRNAATHHHPTIGDSHLSSGVNDNGLEDQIIQQLVAAAAIARGEDSIRAQTETNPLPPVTAINNRSYSSESSSTGSSESLSDSWRSRLSSISMKYKESISENTRAWKEKLFSRSSSSMADIVSEVRTEMNSGFASVSRLMERLDTRDARHQRPSSRGNNMSSSG